jgi:hypothetical protein
MDEVIEHRRLYFPTAVKFTRWVFQQPRGVVEPWAVLVTGWREAKPCLLALQAARTGAITGLRPDAQRPPLRQLPPDYPEDAEVGIAIRFVVVLLDREELRAKAMAWARRSEPATRGLDIFFVGMEELTPALNILLDIRGCEEEAAKNTPTRGRLQSELSCATRTPVVGDTVHKTDGTNDTDDGTDWTLAAGAVAIVEEVDGDGDFRLRNPSGQTSQHFHFRQFYSYVQEKRSASGLKPEPLLKISPDEGFAEWDGGSPECFCPSRPPGCFGPSAFQQLPAANGTGIELCPGRRWLPGPRDGHEQQRDQEGQGRFAGVDKFLGTAALGLRLSVGGAEQRVPATTMPYGGGKEHGSSGPRRFDRFRTPSPDYSYRPRSRCLLPDGLIPQASPVYLEQSGSFPHSRALVVA